MRKHFLLLMLLSLLPLAGFAAHDLTSGSEQTIDGIKYTVLTVYNTEDFNNNKVNTVSAQQNNFTATTINIPATVSFSVQGTDDEAKSINKNATFKVVRIVNAPTTAGAVGFTGLTSVTAVTIGTEGVGTYLQDIEAGAFSGCTNLETVTFQPYQKASKNAPGQTFGANIFRGDAKITSLNLTNTNLATIENYFGTTYAYAAQAAVPYAATAEDYALLNAANAGLDNFKGAGETVATDAMTETAGYSKNYATAEALANVAKDIYLFNLNIGGVKDGTEAASYKKVGDEKTPAVPAVVAVANSTLQSITLPSSWTSIAEGAFENCTKLGTVTFTTPALGAAVYQVVGAKAFLGCPIAHLDMTNTKIQVIPSTMLVDGDKVKYNAKTTTVTMPATLTTIGASAFNGCVGLETVDFSKANLLTTIGNFAFGTTPSLTEIDLSGATSLVTFGATTPFVPAGEMNTELTKITLPVRAQIGGKGVFLEFATPGIALANLPVLSTIENYQYITTIEDGAFANDAALTSLSFGDKLTSITGSPFQGCTNLATLSFDGTAITTFGKTATQLYGTTTNVLTSLTITNDVKAAILDGILTNQAGLATVSIAAGAGKEIKNTATLNAGAIKVAENATITLGKISKDPEADGFIVVGDGTKAATVTTGVINAALTKELVTGKVDMTIAGVDAVGVSLDALGKTATSLTFTGQIKGAFTAYSAKNDDLTLIDFGSQKLVAGTLPTNMFSANRTVELYINWNPDDVDAVAAFAKDAFADAPVALANRKVLLHTTQKVTDDIYGRDEANLYNVVFDAAVAEKAIDLENNGTGSYYYAKYFELDPYKIAKATEDGKKVIVYGAYVDASDKTVYMEQLHIINGYYYIPAGVPVIVKAETNATKALSAAGEGLSSMNLADATHYVSQIACLTAETIGTSLMNNTNDYDWTTFVPSLGVNNKDYDLYALAKISKYNITWKTFGAATTLPAGTFYVRKAKGAGAPEMLNLVWTDGSEADVTGIENVNVEQQFNGEIFNLQGIRVSEPVKGQIYIQNGKKFMMK